MEQLVAIDIDGTLLNSQREITKEVYETIKKAKSHHVHIALCSGRAGFGLKPIINKLPKDSVEYIIAHNGAIIEEVKTGKVISEKYLKKEDLILFEQLSHEFRTHLSFYDKDHLYTTAQEINGSMAENMITQCCKIHILNSAEEMENNILEIQFLEDEDKEIIRSMDELPKELYDNYYIVHSVERTLEITKKGVNKWNGILKLAQYLGVEEENIIAIGDEKNDREMIENAGIGIAMGNAIEMIKEISDFVTKTNDEHGVAYALKNVVYSRS